MRNILLVIIILQVKKISWYSFFVEYFLSEDKINQIILRIEYGPS